MKDISALAMDEKIARINELYHKSRNLGLTEEEKQEQHMLRKDYLSVFRNSLRGQLNNIDIQNQDGSITNLGERHRQTHSNKR